jgi:hypothetical protein
LIEESLGTELPIEESMNLRFRPVMRGEICIVTVAIALFANAEAQLRTGVPKPEIPRAFVHRPYRDAPMVTLSEDYWKPSLNAASARCDLDPQFSGLADSIKVKELASPSPERGQTFLGWKSQADTVGALNRRAASTARQNLARVTPLIERYERAIQDSLPPYLLNRGERNQAAFDVKYEMLFSELNLEGRPVAGPLAEAYPWDWPARIRAFGFQAAPMREKSVTWRNFNADLRRVTEYANRRPQDLWAQWLQAKLVQTYYEQCDVMGDLICLDEPEKHHRRSLANDRVYNLNEWIGGKLDSDLGALKCAVKGLAIARYRKARYETAIRKATEVNGRLVRDESEFRRYSGIPAISESRSPEESSASDAR